MGATLGIVEFNTQAYAKSPETPLGALASRRFGSASVLEWVVRRVSESEQLSQVIVVVGEGPISELARQCTPSNITLFVTPDSDPLARAVSAARRFQADSIVRVCVDNPFVDPVLIDRLVIVGKQESDSADYVGFCGENGSALTENQGMLAEWFSQDSLQRANKLASTGNERGQLNSYILANPDRFKVKRIPAPIALERTDVRLRIDVEEDWDHAQVIYEALGPESLDWQGITGLLDQQPEIRQRMAVLNRNSA